MVDIYSEDYTAIQNLYDNGNHIKSLKKHCNLILKNQCTNDILIEFRKKLYKEYISENNYIDDDTIIMFKCAIEKCSLNNEKYNIPFIKKAISYLEQKANVDYEQINRWLNYFNIELLNGEVYGNNKYSDKEMFYLKKAKTLDEIKKINDLYLLLDNYHNENNQNPDIDFFIKYHICKLLFEAGKFDDANDYLEELLKIKREKYVLTLPIKYHDYTNENAIMFFILEILADGQIQDYLYAYIINWLKSSNFSYIVDNISDDYIKETHNIKIKNYNRLKKDIIFNICEVKDVKNSLRSGKIVNITKTGNGFLIDNEKNYFVNKKYLDKNIKKQTIVKYFLVEKYNFEKETYLTEAIIINGRYLK